MKVALGVAMWLWVLAACTPAGDAVAPEEPVVERRGLALGKLESEELRKTVYAGLEKRLTKPQTEEIGDFDNFQFTVTRLLNGTDDVSGDANDRAPDGMEVEVTGWYKRLGTGTAKPNCFSFDTTTPVVKKAERWVVPDDYQIVFGREDSEDCY